MEYVLPPTISFGERAGKRAKTQAGGFEVGLESLGEAGDWLHVGLEGWERVEEAGHWFEVWVSKVWSEWRIWVDEWTLRSELKVWVKRVSKIWVIV